MSVKKQYTNKEKRKYPRAYFSADNEVTGSIVISSHQEEFLFLVRIMDISLGGLFFTLRRTDWVQTVIKDTPVRLSNLRAASFINIDTEVDMLVRRIQDYSVVEHVGFGCEFVGMGSEVKMQLNELISWAFNRQEKSRLFSL